MDTRDKHGYEGLGKSCRIRCYELEARPRKILYFRRRNHGERTRQKPTKWAT